MSTLEEMLGIDPDDPKVKLARSLVDEKWALRASLIQIRKDRGLTTREVAHRMGVSAQSVKQFEHYSSNPELSSVTRYAMAVGAYVTYQVRADPDYVEDGTA